MLARRHNPKDGLERVYLREFMGADEYDALTEHDVVVIVVDHGAFKAVMAYRDVKYVHHLAGEDPLALLACMNHARGAAGPHDVMFMVEDDNERMQKFARNRLGADLETGRCYTLEAR